MPTTKNNKIDVNSKTRKESEDKIKFEKSREDCADNIVQMLRKEVKQNEDKIQKLKNKIDILTTQEMGCVIIEISRKQLNKIKQKYKPFKKH